MKVFVLGNLASIAVSLAEHGYYATNDPDDHLLAVISDAASCQFAGDNAKLIVLLNGTIADWTAKQSRPEAYFVNTVDEILEVLNDLKAELSADILEENIWPGIPNKQPNPLEIDCKLDIPINSVLILSHSNKGGVGKTSATTALACTLARNRVHTVICDFDFAAPDVASFFNINIRKDTNYLDGAISRDSIDKALVKVNDYLSVLPGPIDVNIPALTGEQLLKVTNILRNQFSVVVGDTCPAAWEKLYLHPLFADADLVYSIVDQSKFSTEETAKYAPQLVIMGVNPARIRLIINRYNPKLASVKQVEQAFCSGFKKGSKSFIQTAAIISEGWEEQVRAMYKGRILNQDEWNQAANEILVLLGQEPIELKNQRKGFFSIFNK